MILRGGLLKNDTVTLLHIFRLTRATSLSKLPTAAPQQGENFQGQSGARPSFTSVDLRGNLFLPFVRDGLRVL